MMSFTLAAKDRQPVELTIDESFLELFKGPDKDYRVEHVLLRGETVQLEKQYADWFYLRQSERVFGWAHVNALLDNRVEKLDMSFDEFLINFEGEREFDIAFRTGFLEADIMLGFELGHSFDDDLRISLNFSEVPGKISETRMATLDFDFYFKGLKSMMPYLVLGAGQIINKPSAQVIGGTSISSPVSKAGIGIIFATSKRISFSAEWVVYSAQDDSFEKELQETSVGLKYLY